MAYHYPTISHYDSGYDKNVAQFLKRIGYSSVEAVSLVDEPILPADTLLGVKYLFTNSTDNKSFLGFQPVAGLENEKFRILENTYALPMAFAVGTCPAESLLAEDNSNPFEHINAIYSELLGYDAALFKKVDTTAAFTDDGIVFSTPITDGALYGYTFQELWLRTSLYIDERLDREYGGWLYQPVYYIGNGETAHTVRLKDYTRPGNEDGTAVYALDMDAFTKAVEALPPQPCWCFYGPRKKVTGKPPFGVNRRSPDLPGLWPLPLCRPSIISCPEMMDGLVLQSHIGFEWVRFQFPNSHAKKAPPKGRCS